jgi:pyrophosphate--fructose-6-phosphate 1-phosphotransferase
VALDLDGLVVIGGDDSNTNAAMLAEHFRGRKIKTAVLGCPKTIDGDLKSKQVPISFGFDTACKIYSEMIGNIMVDARSTQKYYHFIRLMGRAASHITLECALQTHPNAAIIGEEIHHERRTLRQVTNAIADVVCRRAQQGKHFGVFLIPEGLIDFVPEVQTLIAELNDLLAAQACDAPGGAWRARLTPPSRALFASLPPAIQDQLLLERDPHGNVQVAKIETEKMLMAMVDDELSHRRHEDTFPGQFRGQAHFFGYEGRCGMPTNFDATYCYALGFAASALLAFGQTGLIACVSNLTAAPAAWLVGGTALTELMDVERRSGRDKPVIKKAMVELRGGPFREFARCRDAWAVEDSFVSPGPIQFAGPSSDDTCLTLQLETLAACST